MDNKINLVLLAVLLIGVVFVAWAGYTILSGELSEGTALTSFEHSEERYPQFMQNESTNDKCAAPPGYSEESWRQHMSHHPDRYAECLQ